MVDKKNRDFDQQVTITRKL